MRVLFAFVLAGAGAVGCRSESAPVVANGSASVPSVASEQDRYAAFWGWFRANRDRLRLAIEADPVAVVRGDAMNEELKKVHPSLVFELPSKTDRGDQELVISADGDRQAFAAVEGLVAAAPKLDGWTIIAFRPRRPDLDGLTLEIGTTKLSPHAVYYRSEADGDRLGLDIYVPGYSKDAEHLQMAAFLLLDAVLGEHDVETEIGFIEMHAVPDDTSSLRTLPALRDEVDRGKRSRADSATRDGNH